MFAQVWIEECSEVETTKTHLSPPCLVTSQYLHTPHEWSLSIFICPSDSPSSQEGLSPMHRSLGLGHPVCGSTYSLSIVRLCNLLFPLSSLPGAKILTQCLSFHPAQLNVYLSFIKIFIFFLFLAALHSLWDLNCGIPARNCT